MFQRFYDPQEKYLNGIIKEYPHWMLEVNYMQHTLGSYIIFCKRKGVEKISELTDEEHLEMKHVFADIEYALSENPFFKPDRFNYWQMGNELHQLHFHGIPRYAESREFNGKKWTDDQYGSIPKWTVERISQNTVATLRNIMREYIPQD